MLKYKDVSIGVKMIIVVNLGGVQFQTSGAGYYREGTIMLDGTVYKLNELKPGDPVRIVPSDDPNYVRGAGTHNHTVVTVGERLAVTHLGGQFNLTTPLTSPVYFGQTMIITD